MTRFSKVAIALVAILVCVSAVLLGAGLERVLVVGGLTLPFLPVFGMILDERTEFADAVSVAAAAGTALIGDVIDMSVVRNLGVGQPVYLVIQVATEIITGGTAGTIKFQLCSDAQAAIAVDGSASLHFDSGTFVTDDAAANGVLMNAGGIVVCIALPMEGVAYERYLGILATIGTTTVTAGAINAFLTTNPKAWKAYNDAI